MSYESLVIMRKFEGTGIMKRTPRFFMSIYGGGQAQQATPIAVTTQKVINPGASSEDL